MYSYNKIFTSSANRKYLLADLKTVSPLSHFQYGWEGVGEELICGRELL